MTATRVDMISATRAVLARAAEIYADDPWAAALLEHRVARLERPLRLAILGKIKAGKSTLLNALLGEQVALTDVGECTNILTFYEFGNTPVVTLYPRDGAPRAVRFRRSENGLDIDSGGVTDDNIKHIVVRWPSELLRSVTLIDTPGIDSITTEYAERTTSEFSAEDEDATADVVLYLMRHLHESDVRFLESFRTHFAGDDESLNTIAVLSRADEIGAGRIDAMMAADRVAERYADDPALRPLCQTVVPVSGLLATTGRTLTRAEFTALAALADAPREDVEDLLLSADRFGRPDSPVPVSRPVRIALYERLGAFGVRLAIAMIRAGLRDQTVLADELVRRSGFAELRGIVESLFVGRSDLLKSRAALLVVSAIVAAKPRPDADELSESVEALFAGGHEFRELASLAVLRRDNYTLDDELLQEAASLLGIVETSATGRLRSATERLRLPADSPPSVQRELAVAALMRWRDLVVGPMHDVETLELCEAVCRSCEELVVSLGGLTARYDQRHVPIASSTSPADKGVRSATPTAARRAPARPYRRRH